MLDAIGEAVITTDLDGTVAFWNAAAERLFGWTAEEAIGTNVLELTPSANSRDEAREILNRLARGETWQGRFELRRRDGSSFPALVTDAPIFDDEGQLAGIIGISADLTEPLEAERNARRGELHAAIATLAELALNVLSLDALLEKTVMSVATTLQVPLTLVGEFTPSGDRCRPRAGVGWSRPLGNASLVLAQRSTVANGPELVDDYDEVDPAHRSPLLVGHGVRSAVTVRIGGGPGGFGVLGVYDTSPRRFAADEVAFVESVAGLLGGAIARAGVEDELRHLASEVAAGQRVYRELFDLAPDPYLVTDLHGMITHANQAACDLLNVERPAATELAAYVARDEEADFYRGLRAAGEHTRTSGWEVTILPRHRPSVVAHLDVARGTAADGRPVLRWVIYDVTKSRQAQQTLEAAFVRASEDVAHLRDVEEWKNVMLSAAAHDLRTPLTAIVMASETLLERRELPPETRRQLLDSIRRHGRRSSTLLRNLLDLDRLTRGTTRADKEPVRIDELIVDALDAAAVTDHPVTTSLQELTAQVDPLQIGQVIANLVGNAAQHTPAGTPITVSLRADDDTVVIVVEDEGPGLPDAVMNLFAPFATTPRHPDDEGGTGIGLSLVELFVQLHDGTVVADDCPTGGARFTVRLPGGFLDATDQRAAIGTTRGAPSAADQ